MNCQPLSHSLVLHVFVVMAVALFLLGGQLSSARVEDARRTLSSSVEDSWKWTTCIANGSPTVLLSNQYGVAVYGYPQLRALVIDLRNGGIVANGTLPWKNPVALLSQGDILLQLGEAEIHAFLLPSLQTVWSVDTFPIFFGENPGVFTAEGDVFCVLLGEPDVFPPAQTYPSCFSATNGSLLWTGLTNRSSGSGNSSFSPLLESERVLFWYNSELRTVNAADVGSGKLLWSSHQAPEFPFVYAACRGIAVLSTPKGMMAVDGRTGRVLWQRHEFPSETAYCARDVLVTSIGGFDIHNGTSLWVMPSELMNCGTPAVSVPPSPTLPFFLCTTATPSLYPNGGIFFNYTVGDALNGFIFNSESVITPSAPLLQGNPVLASERGFFYVGMDVVGVNAYRYCVHALKTSVN